jgi:uncharacterized damage-inducible protein DinB
MNWTELLKAEMQSTYDVTERLFTQVIDDSLEWKPATGSNWLTTGQLLKHITESCGAPCRAFVTGEWGLPERLPPGEVPPDEELPLAEAMPSVESVAQARQALEEDRRIAFEMLSTAGEDELAHRMAPTPWDSTGMVLGHRLLQMVDHLKQHKGQLFYYLKLQGKPVGTRDLWGT